MVVIINYGTCVRKGNGWRGGEATLKKTPQELFFIFLTSSLFSRKKSVNL